MESEKVNFVASHKSTAISPILKQHLNQKSPRNFPEALACDYDAWKIACIFSARPERNTGVVR